MNTYNISSKTIKAPYTFNGYINGKCLPTELSSLPSSSIFILSSIFNNFDKCQATVKITKNSNIKQYNNKDLSFYTNKFNIMSIKSLFKPFQYFEKYLTYNNIIDDDSRLQFYSNQNFDEKYIDIKINLLPY